MSKTSVFRGLEPLLTERNIPDPWFDLPVMTAIHGQGAWEPEIYTFMRRAAVC